MSNNNGRDGRAADAVSGAVVLLRPEADAGAVGRSLTALGLWTRKVGTGAQLQFVVEPPSPPVSRAALEAIAGVAAVLAPDSPHPRLDAQPRTLSIAGVRLGMGETPVLLAGPCAVESVEQVERTARAVKAAGATFLRGGAYKPRTSPHSFQGHGAEALQWMAQAARRHGLGVVTEVTGEHDAERVAEHSDLMQVGARNMQDFALLRAVGRTHRPVLLKRGFAATVQEWMLAAEHLLVAGAPSVVLCERGVRSFDASTRFLLDLAAVAQLAHVHGLPVVVDPSHATGRRDLVLPLARAALAAGACGLLIEVHDDPGRALSDGPQALLPHELAPLTPLLTAGASQAA